MANQFYNGLVKHIKYTFVLGIIDLIIKSKVRPETTPEEWLKIVSYLYDKNWLHYGYEGTKVVTVLAAYRIKEFDEMKESQLPKKEEGNIIYVPFAASISKDKMIIRRITSEYVAKHPETEQIIFKDYAKNKFIVLKLKGEDDGRKIEAELTSNPGDLQLSRS